MLKGTVLLLTFLFVFSWAQAESGTPPAPTAVAVTPLASSQMAMVVWAISPSSPPVSGYQIEACVDGSQCQTENASGWERFLDRDGNSINTRALVIVEPGKAYRFRVRAQNLRRFGPWGVGRWIQIPPVRPSAPPNIFAGPQDSSVQLSWIQPHNKGGSAISDYQIQFSSNRGKTWVPFPDGVSTRTRATVTGLTNGTSYIFKVAATNAAGTGLFSPSSDSVTPIAPLFAFTSFFPTKLAPNQTVTLNGSGLNRVTEVSLGRIVIPAENIDRANSTSSELIVRIPSGFASGRLSIRSETNQIIESLENLQIEPLCDAQLNIKKSLAIKSPSVVNHPNTVYKSRDLANSHWSFGYLMGRIGGFDPSNPEVFETQASGFILSFLKSIKNDPRTNSDLITVPNGNLVQGRDTQPLIDSLPTKINFQGRKILDLEKLPFVLLSILSRIDLKKDNIQAGEGRFIFGLSNSSQITIILEYGLPLIPSSLNPSNTLAEWAKRWAVLSQLTLGSPEYIAALKTVTDAFSDARFPGRVNESAINQVRTNELALGSFPWQLREWNLRKLNPADNLAVLLPATVKQTPDSALNGKAALGIWAQANRDAILDGKLELKDSDTIVDDEGRTRPLLGAFANVDRNWSVPGVDESLRRTFAINMTCNGCHSSETETSFTHVSPRFVTIGTPNPPEDENDLNLNPSDGSSFFSNFLIKNLNERKTLMNRVLRQQLCQ